MKLWTTRTSMICRLESDTWSWTSSTSITSCVKSCIFSPRDGQKKAARLTNTRATEMLASLPPHGTFIFCLSDGTVKKGRIRSCCCFWRGHTCKSGIFDWCRCFSKGGYSGIRRLPISFVVTLEIGLWNIILIAVRPRKTIRREERKASCRGESCATRGRWMCIPSNTAY